MLVDQALKDNLWKEWSSFNEKHLFFIKKMKDTCDCVLWNHLCKNKMVDSLEGDLPVWEGDAEKGYF
jgi:hypothetical protein